MLSDEILTEQIRRQVQNAVDDYYLSNAPRGVLACGLVILAGLFMADHSVPWFLALVVGVLLSLLGLRVTDVRWLWKTPPRVEVELIGEPNPTVLCTIGGKPIPVTVQEWVWGQ